jgi:hypothetical protein
MKPTKENKKVIALSKNIKKLSKKVFSYAGEKTFLKLGTTHYKKIVCLECGHKFTPNIGHEKCPKCHNKLKIIDMKGIYYEYGRMIVIDAFKDYQVIRYIQVSRTWQKGKKAKSKTFECMQRWISPEGKETILSCSLQSGYNLYSRGINFRNDKMTLSSETKSRSELFGIIYPKRKGSKYSKRNGYKYSVYDLKPHLFFKMILKNNKLETLLKTDKKLFKYFSKTHHHEYLNKYWKQIKITQRHNYEIYCISDWIDMIRTLEELNKDINSPNYICPDDLNKAHNRWNKKLNKRKEHNRLQELKNSIENDNKEYIKRIEPYKNTTLIDNINKIKIEIVASVKQLYLDSLELNHCAFNNEYHNKKNSIILRATNNGKLVETIEYCLMEEKVIQSRGLDNKASKYNKKILDLMKGFQMKMVA